MLVKKILLITGGALIAAGLLLGGIAFAVYGFDPAKLSTAKYVTKTYDVDGDFKDINIQGDTEDIFFEKTDDGVCKIVSREEEDRPHIVKVENGTLNIERQKKSYWNFGINFESPKMTVYLPEAVYEDLKIDSDTGDITIPEDFSFDSMSFDLDTGDVKSNAKVQNEVNIKTDTGDIELTGIDASDLKLESDTGRITVNDTDIKGDIYIKEDTGRVALDKVTCEVLTSEGDTGDINLKDVIVKSTIRITRSTGDVRFDGSDSDEIYVKTSTGDVSGAILSDKVFITESDTGSINVPKTSEGGRCEISTDTGDIKIEVK